MPRPWHPRRRHDRRQYLRCGQGRHTRRRPCSQLPDVCDTISQVIAGIDWVTPTMIAVELAVANMSLGGGSSSALDTAVINSFIVGVTFAVAASRQRAPQMPATPRQRASPPRSRSAPPSPATRAPRSQTTAAASTSSPWALELFSACYPSNTATNTISGTSMSTPHVAVVAALYLHTIPTPSMAYFIGERLRGRCGGRLPRNDRGEKHAASQ